MADEPRRSGRATKGQHKNASSSPPPQPKPTKPSKSKPVKKPAGSAPDDDDDDDEDGEIRCICTNSNPKDKRAFIGCDACNVWQHNVCMGFTEDDEEVPDHYFCEECKPDEHQETLQALARGEKIWEARNKIYQSEKKMSKSRKANRKHGEEGRPGWLKKDVPPLSENNEPKGEPAESSAVPEGGATDNAPEASSKRKREEVDDEQNGSKSEQQEKSSRPARTDKRRKSAAPAESAGAMDPATALVSIQELPQDRQKVAQALSKIIGEDVEQKMNSGYKLSQSQSASALGDHLAAQIEYALFMNHGNPKEQAYSQQFRALIANMKKNGVLIERLLNRSLTPDELSTMSTSDMASDELQRERAVMKEALDRQAIAIPEQGPRYKQDHKGLQLIEDENETLQNDFAARPVTLSTTGQEQIRFSEPQPGPQPSSGSPTQTARQPSAVEIPQPLERRSSSQTFDVNNIWAKTAQSPTATPGQAGARPMQMPARRRSTIQQATGNHNGAKDDPDIDRLLDTNEEEYSPADATGPDAIVWRGKLQQSSEETAPMVNARFAAGRDLASTIRWQDLFPSTLSIDGRLQTSRAEEYLCGLRWSTTSDVCVLTLKPYDNAEAFNNVFDYFYSRKRYAVVAEGKPAMIKDLYVIPVEAGGELPDHVDMLEHCTIKKPIEERLMLMTLVVARSPDSPPVQQASNGHIAPHVRQSASGPSGSPLHAQNAAFSAPHNGGPAPMPYGVSPGAFPPNPYGGGGQQPLPPSYPLPQFPPARSDPRIGAILGDLQYAPSAQQILLSSNNNISDDQLYHLRKILDEDPLARTDMAVLVKALGLRG